MAYTLSPTLSGLKAGDTLTVLKAESELTWANPRETYSFDALLDTYTFNYIYDQNTKTLSLRNAATRSKKAATQSSSQMTSTVVNVIGNKIMGRLSSFSSSVKGQSGGETFKETGVWGKALYTHAHKSGGNAFKADIFGSVIGADGKVSDAATLGIAFSYSQTNGEAEKTDVDANTYAAFLYGGYTQSEKLSYSAMIGGGLLRFDTDNADKFNALFANVQGYADYSLGHGFTVQAGMRYVLTHQSKYAVGATQFKAKDAETLTGVLGGTYDYVSGKYGVQARLAAIYDFIADKSALRAANRGASMYVNGERLHRFGGEAGISATMRTNVWTFELGYDAQVRKDYNDQTISLKADCRF